MFKPKLLDALQGYTRQRFYQDVGAGITVGVVALPLAMAFAIASGLKPEAGLFTAIIAGFLISALGGSRVQIGGPAGAFIVIVYGILERYGLANLMIATAMSGVMLLAMGLLRLGSLIRFIPVAVVIGFTNGIAVLIMVSQLKDFLGLQVKAMPADFFGILHTLSANIGTFNGEALGLAVVCLAVLAFWQLALPRLANAMPSTKNFSTIPGSIVVLVGATMASKMMGLDVETIASRFGSIPNSLPAFAWPDFSWETAKFLLIPATTLALLGSIESLLCARIADQMMADGPYGDRHDANQELMAQGIANLVTPFFGGMPATGTIARTVTNVKNGGNSPVAGIVHAFTLLVVMLVAAPLAGDVPLAALSAILMFVAWNMGEWHEFVHLRQFRMTYRVTLLLVFLLTVIVDLTVAVEVGLIAACLTFIYRISSLTRAEHVLADSHPELTGQEAHVQAHRLYGALFFGAVKLVEAMEENLPSKAVVVDLKNLIYIDTSGADALMSLVRSCRKKKVRLIVCGLAHQPLEMAQRCGLLQALPDTDLASDLNQGLALALGR
ncbi:sodium-independent anion transporter [Limnohabitans sp. Rim8]|uniref:Sodium-independent anion transporter n=1 Tax=Limnohabitans curvus TaxID=323423 RepID=A0A315EQ42_9BURK|nr:MULTISPECIES: SulP family inorganic anion transporter [Limnohabitans]PUE58948.1 sodium-independent anion transporter [Limnohabitans curvus]PUE62169.1 sodium-independent anion transporter [Limnohabitans sp. Rim8]